jgi:cation diffusion facilitator family transporter
MKKGISADKVVLTSLLVDVLDIAIKVTVAIITGSVVMLAGIFQGVADLFSVSVLMIGLKLSRKKPDKVHVFGYGKELYFWTLISALTIIIITATAAIYYGYKRLLDPEEIEHIWLTFVTLSVALIANGYSFSLGFRRLLGGQNYKKIVKVFLSSEKAATKNTFVLDLMGAMASVLGLISLTLYQLLGETRFDAIGSISIGLMMMVLGVVLVIGIKGFIIGKRAPPELEEKIMQSALSISGAEKVVDLKTMFVGPENLLVNIEIHFADKLSTDEIEKLVDRVKEKITKDNPIVHYIQVEPETPK